PHKLEEKELTYGETIKQPFPEYEDIEKDKGISMPPWLTHNLKSGLSDIDLYAIAKTAYESGLDVTWKLSSKDPHAEIKAQHEEALKKYDVVKVFCRDFSNDEWAELSGISWTSPHYRIRFYNIDWNKLLSWSYANGEFIECEFSNYKDFSKISEFGKLKVYDGRFARGCYDYCRIAKGVEIKEEWLVEQKESNA
ncbi:hypothetical protein KA005_20310, partial [bacterium]|nr:hypothetical protein [bacterium]